MMSRDELLQSYIASGLRSHNAGDIGSARDAYQKALSISPEEPNASQLLGVALLQLGQPQQALTHLEHAARKLRDQPAVIGNLAQAYFTLGRYDQAQATFRKASRLNPREAQYPLGVATSLALQGKLGEAEALLRQLTQRFPDNAFIRFNYGNALRDQGKVPQAVVAYREAIGLDPAMAEARNNLAGQLQAQQRFDEAEAEFRACIAIAPDYLLAKVNLASVLIDLGRFREAEMLCREVTKLDPGLGQAHTFLSAALFHQGRLVEALDCNRVAVQLAPHDPKVVETFAASLADAGYFNAGMEWFSRALALDPDSAPAHQMLGMALLANGRLAEGWIEYAYRPARLRFGEKYPQLTLSRTLPADLSGKHICVLREQGLGDEVFFLRYVQQMHEAGARIIYRGSNKLQSFLARVSSLDELIEEMAEPPAADTLVLAGDLAHALTALPASALPRPYGAPDRSAEAPAAQRISVFWPAIPAPLPLGPLPERVAATRARLAQAGAPPYVGITWQGGTPPHLQQGVAWTLYKRVDIALLGAAISGVEGTFVALQRHPAPGEIEALGAAIGRPVHDFTDLNEDLEGMLAVLALLDEYIGVSNTNMHLRAGVGRTARVLVPCPAEWRWMARGRESPWFPGFTIYRQSNQGDWGAALAALERDLATQWEFKD